MIANQGPVGSLDGILPPEIDPGLKPPKLKRRRLKRVFKSPKFWLIIALISLVVLVGGAIGLSQWYVYNLRPVSASSRTIYFTVERGTSLHQIAIGLKKAGLIRSQQAFEYYVRTNELYSNLQAGTYSFSQSLSVKSIVAKIVKGDVAKNLLTILPGKRLDEIKQTFANAGYSKAQIDEAFNPNTYGSLPALASLSLGATLEGYLYPDSFQKSSETPATVIVQESLDELNNSLTNDILAGVKSQGLTTYQAITLASIIYQETDNPKYQPTVAQVFLSRLKQGMPLQSNVTANYAADLANKKRDVTIDSPYNTYLRPGLPPGPIGNFTLSAIRAVAAPSNSDFLYFVAGDDGVIHFTHTAAEHDEAVAKYCLKKCSQ